MCTGFKPIHVVHTHTCTCTCIQVVDFLTQTWKELPKDLSTNVTTSAFIFQQITQSIIQNDIDNVSTQLLWTSVMATLLSLLATLLSRLLAFTLLHRKHKLGLYLFTISRTVYKIIDPNSIGSQRGHNVLHCKVPHLMADLPPILSGLLIDAELGIQFIVVVELDHQDLTTGNLSTPWPYTCTCKWPQQCNWSTCPNPKLSMLHFVWYPIVKQK